MMNLTDILKNIEPFDKKHYIESKNRWNNIAKPLDGLGLFEEMVCKISAIKKQKKPNIHKKAVAVFCSDNGVVAEGVTQTDQKVTSIVANNMAEGKASVCKMAKVANADVFIIDVGISTSNLSNNIIDKKIALSTKNMKIENAMTRKQAETAIMTGIEISQMLFKKGYDIVSAGEMGIGNTCTASAVASVILNEKPQIMTGIGAGLSNDKLKQKVKVIEQSILNNKPNRNDMIDILQKVGGFDICAMCGFYLGCAYNRIPCVIDGFIASVAALCAVKLNSYTYDYLIASHISSELGAQKVMKSLKFNAPISAGMHLGEGTGAVALFPLLDMSLSVFNEMETFDEIKIKAYERFEDKKCFI